MRGDIPNTGRTANLVNRLELALRSGEVDPKLLDELKWDVTEARAFVDAYHRAAARAQRQTDRTELPAGEAIQLAPPKPRTVLRADTGTGRDAGSLRSDRTRSADAVRELLEPGRQRVTPKYRTVLEAYYRSVTSRPQ